MPSAGVADCRGGCGAPVDERILYDRRGDVVVAAGGGKYMSTAKRSAPQGDSVMIDAAEAADERDGCAVIGALSPDVDQAAGFTGAGAQVAVIEGEGGYADGGEADREIGQGRASDTADAMG